jgi:3-deoxy-D-manno-octulosonic-acid transferase
MLEAAALGKCTMFGTHAFNFKQTVDALLEGNGAILVSDTYELQKAMEKCMEDESYRNEIAANGRQVIIDNQGATTKTIDKISKLLSTAK